MVVVTLTISMSRQSPRDGLRRCLKSQQAAPAKVLTLPAGVLIRSVGNQAPEASLSESESGRLNVASPSPPAEVLNSARVPRRRGCHWARARR